jgi:hypothetical protein
MHQGTWPLRPAGYSPPASMRLVRGAAACSSMQCFRLELSTHAQQQCLCAAIGVLVDAMATIKAVPILKKGLASAHESAALRAATSQSSSHVREASVEPTVSMEEDASGAALRQSCCCCSKEHPVAMQLLHALDATMPDDVWLPRQAPLLHRHPGAAAARTAATRRRSQWAVPRAHAHRHVASSLALCRVRLDGL